MYYELYCKLALQYNSVYKSQDKKNNYILKPNGKFSSLTLITDSNKSINTEIINNNKYQKNSINITRINNNKNKTCNEERNEEFIENFYNLSNNQSNYEKLKIDISSDIELDLKLDNQKKYGCTPLNLFFNCLKI